VKKYKKSKWKQVPEDISSPRTHSPSIYHNSAKSSSSQGKSAATTNPHAILNSAAPYRAPGRNSKLSQDRPSPPFERASEPQDWLGLSGAVVITAGKLLHDILLRIFQKQKQQSLENQERGKRPIKIR